MAPNYLVTKLWHDSFSKYRLTYTGETDNLSIITTLSENGQNVIVKIVNPTENVYDLTIDGDWKSLTGAGYEFIAPGSLKAANSMESPHAVSVEKKEITPVQNGVTLNVVPYSAGVINSDKRILRKTDISKPGNEKKGHQTDLPFIFPHHFRVEYGSGWYYFAI